MTCVLMVIIWYSSAVSIFEGKIDFWGVLRHLPFWALHLISDAAGCNQHADHACRISPLVLHFSPSVLCLAASSLLRFDGRSANTALKQPRGLPQGSPFQDRQPTPLSGGSHFPVSFSGLIVCRAFRIHHSDVERSQRFCVKLMSPWT